MFSLSFIEQVGRTWTLQGTHLLSVGIHHRFKARGHVLQRIFGIRSYMDMYTAIVDTSQR